MTRETAACESPKCSASDLKLTLCLAGFRTKGAGPDLERGIRGVWSGSLAHQTVAGQALQSALTTVMLRYVMALKYALNRFSMLFSKPERGAPSSSRIPLRVGHVWSFRIFDACLRLYPTVRT